MNKIRVLLADDHALVREGLRSLVNAQPEMEVVAEAVDGPSALTLTAEFDPDVVVMDISMPGLNGAQATAQLRAACPDRKILILTVHEDTGYLRLLLDVGAAGYVLKRAAAAELMQAIRTVAAGGRYLDPTLAASLVTEVARPSPEAAVPAAELSEREADVVRLIALGYSNKEIAAQLQVAVKTIETCKTRLMEKLHLHGRVDIVRYAAQRGWLQNA